MLTSLELNLATVRTNVLKELDPNYSPTPEDIAVMVDDKSRRSEPRPIDITKRYDVHYREGDREIVYRNVLFKGLRTLFPKNEYDALSQFIELEQADQQTIFVARGSVIKFSETLPGKPE